MNNEIKELKEENERLRGELAKANKLSGTLHAIANGSFEDNAIIEDALRFCSAFCNLCESGTIRLSEFPSDIVALSEAIRRIDRVRMGFYDTLEYVMDCSEYSGRTKTEVLQELVRVYADKATTEEVDRLVRARTGKTSEQLSLFAQKFEEEKEASTQGEDVHSSQDARETRYSRGQIETYLGILENLSLSRVSNRPVKEDGPNALHELMGDFHTFVRKGELPLCSEFSGEDFSYAVKQLLEENKRLQNVDTFASELSEALYSK